MQADAIHRRPAAALAAYRGANGFTFRLLRLPQDVPLLHRWFTQERAAFWLMQHKTPDEVQRIYRALMDSAAATAYIGLFEGRPAFLAECYDPAQDRIRGFYSVQPGDLGMHVFIGPPEVRIPGFTRAVFQALMRFMFDHLGAQRVVVEPDATHQRIHALNRSAGFVYDRDVVFAEKTASLAFCTRRDFERALSCGATVPKEIHP